MLVDYTYFQGKGIFYIPNIDPAFETGVGNYDQLNAFINTIEPEIMNKVIGKTLYDLLIAGLAVTTPDAKWTALKAKLVDATKKTSPIANYIYFRIAQTQQATRTDKGDVVMTGGNIAVTGNHQLLTSINNQMVDWIIEFQDWFNENLATYPEYDGEGIEVWSKDNYINFIGI